jgi:hypothetical protein
MHSSKWSFKHYTIKTCKQLHVLAVKNRPDMLYSVSGCSQVMQEQKKTVRHKLFKTFCTVNTVDSCVPHLLIYSFLIIL